MSFISFEDFGAQESLSDNSPAFANLSAAAAVHSGTLFVFVGGSYEVSEDVQVPENVCLAFNGGCLSGTATITIEGEVSATKTRIFSDDVTIHLRPHRTRELYPEWWGAAPMLEPRDSAVGGTHGVVDCTAAFNRMLNACVGYAYGATIYAIDVFLSGWYAVTDEIPIINRTVRFRGHGPLYGGSGFRSVAVPAIANATKSILYFQGASNSELDGIGFIANPTDDPTTRLLAAIRTSWINGISQTQRRITVRNCGVGDQIGYFNITAPGLFFQNAFLSGGDGTSNGNDDFHVIDNFLVNRVDRGIRITNNQAVEWDIRQYGISNSNWMFESDTGGTINGNGWYAAQSLAEGVFRFNGDYAMYAQKLRVTGFACEHMKGFYFIKSTVPIHGILEGKYISFNAQDPAATMSQATSTVTASTEFFADFMVGKRITWDTSSTAIITAFIDSKNVTVCSSQSVASGNARITEADGSREAKIIDAPHPGTGFNIELENFQIQFDTPPGVSPNPVRRLTIYSADSSRAIQSRLLLKQIINAFDLALNFGNAGNVVVNNRIFDIEFQNCTAPSGSFSQVASFKKRLIGTEGLDTTTTALFLPFSYLAANQAFDMQTQKMTIGDMAGGLFHSILSEKTRVSVPSESTATFNGFLRGGRLYLGVPVRIGESNKAGTNAMYYLKVGTAADPEKFGRVQNCYLAGSSNGMGGTELPYSAPANTDLVLTLFFGPSGTTSQSGNTVTHSSSIFTSSHINQTMTWLTGPNAGCSTTITAVSGTTATVSCEATVATGTIEISYPMVASDRILIQPLAIAAFEDNKAYSQDRFLNLPILAGT